MNSGSSFIPTTVTLAALLSLSCLTCQAADRASWYGEKERGLPMANGQRFNPDKLTAASWFFDFGTKVVVTHANRSVVVLMRSVIIGTGAMGVRCLFIRMLVLVGHRCPLQRTTTLRSRAAKLA